MAEYPAEYHQYIQQGHDAAWEQNWRGAVEAYAAAMKLVPEDPDVHVYLGGALVNAGQLDRALKLFNRAAQLSPDDPVPLEKSADVLERMGRLREAAQQYIKVSDIYLAQRDLDKAIGNWERATQLTPGLVAVHAKLAQAYERIGEKKKAVREYLTLAFNFRRLEQVDNALKAVERALRLDPKNPQALNTRRALQAGGEIILPESWIEGDEPPKKESSSTGLADPFAEEEDELADIGDSDPLGPMGEAMNEALMLLAQYVVESGSLDASGAAAMQAMELQRQEAYEEAISAYLQAESGLRHPALKMNLGALCVLAQRPQDAINHLSDAIIDPKLSAGALHALGQAYYQLGQHKKASQYLVQSLQAVDTSLSMSSEENQELLSTYERIVAALDATTEESLARINERFIGLLSGKDWKRRIPQTRRHLEETMRGEGEAGVVDLLVAASSDALAEKVSQIDRYIRQGLYTLAMDECHRAIEDSPYYLPVHVRMAEIMMAEGRLRQAIDKYNMVARSYLVREEHARAAAILQEVLDMAPLDISVRMSLIELLENEERWDEVLDQYVGLADTYQKLGNFDQSRETYEAAERLAQRISAPVEKIVAIRHAMADIDQMRLATRKAQKVYESIVEIMPTDEKALRALVDIYFQQGKQVEAIRSLDQLLGIYAKRKQINRIVQSLEELVKHYPNETGLRSRLARIYSRLGRKREAIEQLDALGELQLEAGLHKDAIQTIRQIIALKPEHVEAYKRLLSELGG